jgi:polysaccharide pyruvyl transferase WcaK-like protein
MNMHARSEAMSAKLPKRVFITGVFDMNNYGDLLFPLIASFRLQSSGIDVVPVAPTTAAPTLVDVMPVIGVGEMMGGRDAVDAILIGGGYIVHHQRMDFLKEYRKADLAHWAASGLWLGATLAGAIRDVPVIWNAPGVLHLFTEKQRASMAPALRAADYISVRDRGGAELLAPPGDVSVDVVPDTVADLARMWPLPSLDDSFRNLIGRKGLSGDAAYLAFHVRNRSVANYPLATVGAWLDEFAAARGLVPILIAIGQSHDDAAIAREFSQHLRQPHVLLDDPTSLREITAAIAHARLYVGASLHGYVASAAYDVPGVLVARPAYRKFGGFLEHTGRREDLVRDWSEAFAAGARRLEEPALQRIPESVFAALDRHWTKVRAAIADPARKREERDCFLRSCLRLGAQADGPGWVLDAFLPRAGRAGALPARQPGLESGTPVG